jgi:hypothetical protein
MLSVYPSLSSFESLLGYGSFVTKATNFLTTIQELLSCVRSVSCQGKWGLLATEVESGAQSAERFEIKQFGKFLAVTEPSASLPRDGAPLRTLYRAWNRWSRGEHPLLRGSETTCPNVVLLDTSCP